MSIKIHIKPNEVWSFCQNNMKRLESELVAIAENEERGVAVYVTEDSGFPQISVINKSDTVLHEEAIVSQIDSEHVATQLFEKYMVEDEEYNTSQEDFEEEIREREELLMLAFEEFLITLTDDVAGSIYDGYNEEEIEEFLNKVIRMAAVDYGIRVRRPMFLIDDETQKEVFSEYPYEEYDFSDEEFDKVPSGVSK